MTNWLLFIPQIGLEGIIGHTESLTNYMQKAVNDTTEGISLLNPEVKMMRKAILQNWMALDSLTVAQRGTVPLSKQNVVCSFLTTLQMCALHYRIYDHKSVQGQTLLKALTCSQHGCNSYVLLLCGSDLNSVV